MLTSEVVRIATAAARWMRLWILCNMVFMVWVWGRCRVNICFTWNIDTSPRPTEYTQANWTPCAACTLQRSRGEDWPPPPPSGCAIIAGRGILSDLAKCTKVKLSSFHRYFTPLQFNALKSRGGFTSSNFGQTRRTQGWVLLTLPPHPSDNPILKFGNITTTPSSPISSDLRIWVTSDLQIRLSSHLKTGKSEF